MTCKILQIVAPVQSHRKPPNSQLAVGEWSISSQRCNPARNPAGSISPQRPVVRLHHAGRHLWRTGELGCPGQHLDQHLGRQRRRPDL